MAWPAAMILGPPKETWFNTLKALNWSDRRMRSVRKTDFCRFASSERSQLSRILGRKRGPVKLDVVDWAVKV